MLCIEIYARELRMSNLDRIARYCRQDRDKIEGWFNRIDACMFQNILTMPDIEGAVAEIGVHHGKSFIALALANNGQRAYAIDIFGKQHLNADKSGSGDYNIFLRNLRRHGLDPQAITIDSRLSTEVAPADILDAVGEVRFFHVDGGHTFAACHNDLELADQVLSQDGVVVVDDVFNPHWPEVAQALHVFLTRNDFSIFATGPAKAYLCRPKMRRTFQAALLDDPLLVFNCVKRYHSDTQDILIFGHTSRTYGGVLKFLQSTFLARYPDLSLSLVKLIAPRKLANKGKRYRRHLADDQA